MKPAKSLTWTLTATMVLTILNCCTRESFAKQVLTSFVSCEITNAALEKAGITAAMLHDANSNEAVAAKVLSLLSDKSAAKLLANPRMLTMDGEAGRIEGASESGKRYKVDVTATIKNDSLIDANIGWQKTNPNNLDIESVKTRMQLHSGKPVMISGMRIGDYTRFLIVTSEILVPKNATEPNKPCK
jgi:hypothetical protein